MPAHNLGLLAEVTAGHVDIVLPDDSVLVSRAPVRVQGLEFRGCGCRDSGCGVDLPSLEAFCSRFSGSGCLIRLSNFILRFRGFILRLAAIAACNVLQSYGP